MIDIEKVNKRQLVTRNIRKPGVVGNFKFCTFTQYSKRIFYTQESVSLLCPAPYTLPSVEDWRS